MNVLDILFPKKCVSCRAFSSFLCADCFSQISFDVETICVVCNRGAVDGITHPGCRTRFTLDGVISSVTYNRVMKKALYAYKYAPYVKQSEEILIELFYEGIIQREIFHQMLRDTPVLVPIPLHPAKLRSRGYNQAENLSQGLGIKLVLPVQLLLERTKKTSSQFTLTREERAHNISGAFAVTKHTAVPSAVILVDDLVTSGATLLEGATVLKKAGVKHVWAITLAHGH